MLSLAPIVPPTSAAHVQQLELRKVALSGESPERLPAIGTFREFAGAPVIDNQGNVAFIASRGPGPVASNVWVRSDAGLRMVAKSGGPAPATGAAFAQFSDVVIADGGITAFKATLAGTAIGDDNRDSIWLDRSGTLTLFARAGQKAPDPAAELRFSHFETPIAVNGDGQISFFARTRDKEGGTAQSSGLWTAGSGGVSLAADAGGTAIDGLPDVVFSPQSFEQPFANNPVISPSGQTIFRGFLAGPGVDESNLNGLWSYSELAGLRLMVRAGEVAEGTGGKAFLGFPGIPTINAAGDTAFVAFFGAAHDGAAELGLGLWLRRTSGELHHIFAIGDDAPGIAGDVHFVDSFNPVMNAASRVAFLAAVAGEGVNSFNEVGLWSNGMSPHGGLRLIARQGDNAPGSENGFVFGVFLEPSLNAAGQSAFMAAGFRQVDGTILDNAFGIWGQDRTGHLRLVARVGQILEIGPGDHREIAFLAFASETGGEDGKARGLNDQGQVVLRATFTDGSSGVFVSNALTVPEPCSLVLILLAGMRFGLSRRSISFGNVLSENYPASLLPQKS
ncbi:MAG: choice-of-anchor tandem repeat NxxGxxAF-containing protein [Pirellulales bacterium]